MAKKNDPPHSSDLPRLTKPHAHVARQINARVAKGHKLGASSIETSVELFRAEAEYTKWHEYNKAMLKKLFVSDEVPNEYEESFGIYHYPETPPFSVQVNEYYQALYRSIMALESIAERLELYDVATAEQAPGSEPVSGADVFIVHGHDEGARDSLARFIQTLGLNPIILHERPNKGRTIIKKLEDEASPAEYAVVLLTADDIAASKEEPEDTKPRARQNVILELGFFVGKLGRSRVCPLYKGEVELPSDILGVGWVQMDPAGAWKMKLAQELKSAGLEFDADKLLGPRES